MLLTKQVAHSLLRCVAYSTANADMFTFSYILVINLTIIIQTIVNAPNTIFLGGEIIKAIKINILQLK